ncbi:hypothetical protein JCM8097_003182 [Rhodosporidiobolus ruineniae]
MLLSASLVVLGALSAANAAAPDIAHQDGGLPSHLRYRGEVSFRGLTEGRVPRFDMSGHATALPGVHDFLRLTPATPLAHGALFSTAPLPTSEWIVEFAFRVHGPQHSGMGELTEDGKVKKGGLGTKGGRGLALWVTKEGLPGDVTISSASGKVNSPPPLIPSPNDPTDDSISLFGSRTKFDGLGVIFDSSPTAPLLRRSDPRNIPDHHQAQLDERVGATGVVSGIMDDGSGGWLDKEGRVIKGEEEAAYLERAVGECEAAFRNNQGLLWARVAYFNSTIRVDLDLDSHTSLSKAGRHYEHNCFTLQGVKLNPGMHLGVSALASGSTEPDAVDVYALDVFEVLPDGWDAPAPALSNGTAPPAAVQAVVEDEPVDMSRGEELEGTSGDEIPTLTHEIFLSQARMVEAIDALARKVESMHNTVSQAARSGALAGVPGAGAGTLRSKGGEGRTLPEQRLSALDAQLQHLVALVTQLPSQVGAAGGAGGASGEHSESMAHLVQLQDRLMEEVKAVGRKVDGSTGQQSASLSSLMSRTSEQLQILKSTATFLDSAFAPSLFSGLLGKAIYTLVGIAVGVVFAAWREKRRRDDPWAASGKGGKYF